MNMKDTLLEMYQLAVKHCGEDSASARAMKTQLEVREFHKEVPSERLFVVGGVGKQMRAIKRNKPA
jgi:hypothetical protein